MPGSGHESQDWAVTQEGGAVTLFTALPLHPTPKHGVYPLAVPYLAQMHSCSQKCPGDVMLIPNHREREQPGTWLSIYCSANRGCWGPARLLPSSHPPPSSLQDSFPEPSGSPFLSYSASVTEQVTVSRGLSPSSVSLVPSSGAEGTQLSTSGVHHLCSPSFGNSGHLGILASGSLLP